MRTAHVIEGDGRGAGPVLGVDECDIRKALQRERATTTLTLTAGIQCYLCVRKDIRTLR